MQKSPAVHWGDGGIYRVISSTFTVRRSIAAILTLQPSQQVETP
ncbi:hypothetical protein [Nostoc sp.]